MQTISMKTKCLIFSKDRAAQLLALLESLEARCTDFDALDVSILYKASSVQHDRQYDILKEIYPNMLQSEHNFEKDVRHILSNAEYILFLVDDCIFVNMFKIRDVTDAISKHCDCIGFSLRLGRNTSYCYPFDCMQKMPAFDAISNNILKYNWSTSEYDFGYPIDISSSIYRTEDISSQLFECSFDSVNGLEGLLFSRCNSFRKLKPCLLCFDISCAFCNPLNVVSCVATNRNRRSGKVECGVDQLSQKFSSGMKIDISRFYGLVTRGCHQEFSLEWVRRDV